MRVLPFALAVEQRHVEPKARHVPTLTDGRGEQCEKQRRERGVVPFGDVLQRAAFLCIQLYGGRSLRQRSGVRSRRGAGGTCAGRSRHQR